MGYCSTIRGVNTMKYLLSFLLLAGVAFAQETHHCPDGWHLYEVTYHGQTYVHCFLIGDEYVTKATSDIICRSHGGWTAEPYYPGINNYLKNMLFDNEPNAQQGNQWWIGATTKEQHSEHHPGTWWWPNHNSTVEWFDWGEGEPNNSHHSENCVSFFEWRDPIFPIFRDFTWNDKDCASVARYLCEKPCADCHPHSIRRLL